MKTNKTKTKLRIVERKLGRERAVGICYFDENLIEIDESLRGKERLFVLVHELCHRSFPELSEKEILRIEKVIGEGIWQDSYRQVDNVLK